MERDNDIKRTENISNFVNKETIKTNPFGDNKMALRAYKKAERIVAALYLITNHLPSEEPIKNSIRKQSANLLSSLIILRDEMRTVGSMRIYDTEALIREIISLVRIVAVAGYVSFENSDILTQALDNLGIFMESSRRSYLSENIRLSREDLSDSEIMTNDIVKDIKDNKKGTNPQSVVLDKSSYSAKGISTNTRKESIMQVLSSHSYELSIKDISLNLPEYSEKMIQRELAELVLEGRVAKIGSKRWSKYLLTIHPESSQNVPEEMKQV